MEVETSRRLWRPGRRRQVRPVAISFTASLAIQLANLLTGVLIARILGPHGRGELAAVILWPTILAIGGSAGLVEATTYQTARGVRPYRVLVGTALALVVAELVVLGGLGVLVVSLALRNYDPDVVRTAYLFLLFIPLNLLTVYMMGIINGRQRFLAFHALRFAVILASAVGLVGLAVVDELTVRNAAIAYLVANLLTCLLATAIVLGGLEGRPRVSRSLGRELLSFGVKSHVSNVSSLLNERLDQMVISAFLAPVQLGHYVVAVTFTSMSTLLGYSVSSVALPAVAHLPTDEERRRAARRYIALTFVGTTVAVVPVVLAVPLIIEVVFGRDFLDAVDVARILLLASILLATGRVVGTVLKAVNRPMDAGLGELVGLAVTAAGLAVLLPLLGLVGAGLASLLAYAAAMAWLARRAMLVLDLDLAHLLLPDRAWVVAQIRRLSGRRAV